MKSFAEVVRNKFLGDQTIEQIFEFNGIDGEPRNEPNDYVICKYYSLFIRYNILVQTRDAQVNLELKELYEQIVQMLLNIQVWIRSLSQPQRLYDQSLILSSLVENYLERIQSILDKTELDFDCGLSNQVLEIGFPHRSIVEGAESRELAQLYVWIIRHLMKEFAYLSLYHTEVIDWE